MYAALEGHSHLGIPKAVAQEFLSDDTEPRPEDVSDLSDFETAEAIRDGELPSPTQFGDFWLFDLRITGTGMAYRDALDEWAFRDPEKWLSDEFVQRCNGLPVIWLHPDGTGLNTEEFRERAIGNIVLPYIKGEEVWGVAKIFDSDAALAMQKTHRTTSPGVTPPKGATAISLESGARVLDEGLPLILDHLAICEAGVWDKDGPPTGVRLDSLIGKGEVVAEKTREELEAELKDAKARADAAEKERDDFKRKHDAAESEKEERENKEREDAKRRKDEEEAEREAIEKEEREKADAAKADAAKKADARKKHHDAEKHDGVVGDCARCDEHEKNDASCGAPVQTVEPNREEQIKDSKRIDELQAKIDRLTAERAPLSVDERNAVAAAFHRADSVYQMLGERTPQVLPGEKPIAYRKRLADGLRRHTKTFKDEQLHDSVSGRAFDLLEDGIYAEALAEAKNPTINDAAGILREVVTTKHGKTRTEFYGDSRAAWAPFMPQVGLRITRFGPAQKAS